MSTTLPENSRILAAFWDRFIDWEGRWNGTGRFILSQLEAHGCHKLFDAALGDGCDTIHLLRTGKFDVRANEVDGEWRRKAIKTAADEGFSLESKVTDFQWQLENFPELIGDYFDCVLCLGNSLTYLDNESDQLKALKNFRKLLRPGGILLIDERNYQPLLDNASKINKQRMSNNHVENPFPFTYSGKYVYCGKEVHGFPFHVDGKMIEFRYIDSRSADWGYLHLYAFARGELKRLLEKAGFESSKISQYADLKPGDDKDADFYHYVCEK